VSLRISQRSLPAELRVFTIGNAAATVYAVSSLHLGLPFVPNGARGVANLSVLCSAPRPLRLVRIGGTEINPGNNTHPGLPCLGYETTRDAMVG